MLSRRFLVLGVLAIAGCASLSGKGAYPPAGPYPELEPVRLIRSGPEGVVIGISSRGCAARPDIAYHLERRNGVATLAFARRRLATCKDGQVDWVEVAFTRAELGLAAGEPVFLLNPLAERPGR